MHRRKGERDIYFVYNNGEAGWSGELTLRATGAAEIWDAVTGEIGPVEAKEADGCSVVPLSLEPFGSKLVVFSR